MKRKLLIKWYQFQANIIIYAMKTVPIEFIPFVYTIGIILDETAIEKDIWLN